MTQTSASDESADFGQALADELREQREKRGLTRRQIEDETRLGRSTVQRIENGQRPADAIQLAKIVKAIALLDAPEFPVLTVGEVVQRAEGRMVTVRPKSLP
jgi:transcriptional regulator with XRE-family HTH domain